jgi:hypothetical protein
MCGADAFGKDRAEPAHLEVYTIPLLVFWVPFLIYLKVRINIFIERWLMQNDDEDLASVSRQFMTASQGPKRLHHRGLPLI